jgi:FG-GAP-like repeat/ASPIC and UnbV
MRRRLWVGAAGILCAAFALGGSIMLTDPQTSAAIDRAVRWGSHYIPSKSSGAPPPPIHLPVDAFPLFSSKGFETAGFATAGAYTGAIADRASLAQVKAAVKGRAERGIAELSSRLRSIAPDSPDRALSSFQLHASMALLLMYEGKFDAAAISTQSALAESTEAKVPPGLRANLEALLGVINLRRGETENCIECVGPSSCIFPIASEAVHQRPSGSREAIRHFRAYLDQRPEDFGVRWLLNIAFMTSGEYPDKVPPGYLIPLEPFRSSLNVQRFENVASRAGLTVRGANMAGGSAFDDFSGDGLPDVLTSSYDVDLGASLFVNRGDGTFEDRSVASGLASQPLAVNVAQADFDNDGRLDVLLVRGGWETPYPLSLLRNKGAGVFEDVTTAAGLAEPIASHSGAWGDFDKDGNVDLFVCGEFGTSDQDGLYPGALNLSLSDPRNRCRLYRNRGDGTFVNVAETAQVCNDRFAKGAAWGDYDADGYLDLYVSNFAGGNRLYHNRRDGSFEDVAPRFGLTKPEHSFSCWFWDFDNDGRFDLFVNDYSSDLQGAMASALGRTSSRESHPRLYRNLGAAGFRDVAPDVGLDRVILAMGSNFGDIDNDGFLDFYLGTGLPGYSALIPNLLFKNVDGRRFEDVTSASGTGHLQKGHGVSFADWDSDGDLDLFVETGGAVPGDTAFNVLFANPGNGRHWLKLKLVGTKTNRAALGARIQVDLKQPDGTIRSIYRQVGGASSYGGNSLVEHIGLGDNKADVTVKITWPASRSSQTFHGIAVDQFIQITEGIESPRALNAPTKNQLP